MHGVGKKFIRYPAGCPCRDRYIVVMCFTHGILIGMDPDREEEVLLNVACGLDPLTAIAAASDEKKPPKPQRSGCLAALLLVVGIALAVVTQI